MRERLGKQVEWVEASGKSLPEAKEIVLDLLGVAEDDAEFVVLSEPKAGCSAGCEVRPGSRPGCGRSLPHRSGAGARSRTEATERRRPVPQWGRVAEERVDRVGPRGDGANEAESVAEDRAGLAPDGAASSGPTLDGDGASGSASMGQRPTASSRSSRRRRGGRGGGGGNDSGGQPSVQGKQATGREPGESEEHDGRVTDTRATG